MRSFDIRCIKEKEALGKLTNLPPSDTSSSRSQQTLTSKHINGLFRIPRRGLCYLFRARALASAFNPHRC